MNTTEEKPQQSALTRLSIKSWNFFSEWSVEFFIGFVVIGAVAGFFVYKNYVTW